MREPKITVRDLPQKDIEEANKIMNMRNMSKKGKMSKISALTGLCSKCKEKPAVKVVLIKVPDAYKLERYCLEHFHHSAYEDKTTRKKNKRKSRNAN